MVISIHRPSFTHFTLVLESIHTCQGREHSLPKRRVETSAVRSAPTHKPTHQSQYSVHDSLLQLLKTNGMISTSTVFQVRIWCRFCIYGHVTLSKTHRHKFVTVEITNDCNLTREPCRESLQSNKMSTRALYTPSILHKRSAPTHKPTHQSQCSVHDSLLQLYKFLSPATSLPLSEQTISSPTCGLVCASIYTFYSLQVHYECQSLVYTASESVTTSLFSGTS